MVEDVGANARGRFAPSPTGELHLGNLRTAVLAWMWSRRDGGGFVVRMEDLDRVTSSREHEAAQLRDLAAIGLDWDGPVVRQSDRFDLYHAAIDSLTRQGLTYECYCTRREIAEAAAAPHATPGRYPGTCRRLSADARRAHHRDGRPPALRLRSDERELVVDDEFAGPAAGVPDDIVVRRNDGVPAYHVAVVVDDDDQGVRLVVRGDDLLGITPSQVHLADLLGIDAPRYAHVPLVVNERGERLAKRDGAVTLTDRSALGENAGEVLGRLLASCGVPTTELPPDDPARMLRRAAEAFDPDRLPGDAVAWTAIVSSGRSDGG